MTGSQADRHVDSASGRTGKHPVRAKSASNPPGSQEEDLFINTYLAVLSPCTQVKTLRDRVEMFKFFNYLRAVSWCAMAWTEYIKPGRLLYNCDTFHKIEQYLEPEFLNRIVVS